MPTGARPSSGRSDPCQFVERTGGRAAIGSIKDTAALVSGEAGTIVALDASGLETVEAR